MTNGNRSPDGACALKIADLHGRALRQPISYKPLFDEAIDLAVEQFTRAMLAESELRDAMAEAGDLRASERALSAAYLRLRAMIPGAFDTPHAPTPEQVWQTTEKALANANQQSANNSAK